MVNQLKYSLAALFTIPLLPVMYFQGKKIRARVPDLPEAIGTEGTSGDSAHQLQLLTLGESTIAGVGVDQHKNGFTGALADYLAEATNYKVNWKVNAKSGYTASQVANILIPKIQNFHPDLIVIGLGANDAFALNSPYRWRKGMENVLSKLNNTFPKAKIICTNMPPIKEFPAFTPMMKGIVGSLVELLGNELESLVKRYDNVYYINHKLTIDDWINRFNRQLTIHDFFSDGVHPSPLTYQTWGKEVGIYIIENQIMELFE